MFLCAILPNYPSEIVGKVGFGPEGFDFGTTPVTTMHVLAYKALRKKLGLEEKTIRMNDPLLQALKDTVPQEL